MTTTDTRVGQGPVQTEATEAPLRTVMPMEQKYGPRTAEVEAVLKTLRGFTDEQWQVMAASGRPALRAAGRVAAEAAAWDAATHTAGIAAWDAATHTAWDAAEVAAARLATLDAAGAEVVADLISPEDYATLTGPFRLACDVPPWHTDADLWPYFLELVPALGIDGARQAVELTALPRS